MKNTHTLIAHAKHGNQWEIERVCRSVSHAENEVFRLAQHSIASLRDETNVMLLTSDRISDKAIPPWSISSSQRSIPVFPIILSR